MQLDHSHHKPSQIPQPLTLLLDNFIQPENVGSVFRIADAYALEKIVLTGTTPTPPNKKLKRAARSCEKTLPFEYAPDSLQAVQAMKAQGFLIIALEIASNSLPITQYHHDTRQKTCLILGAESAGVSHDLLNECDVVIHIPMLGQNSSMNVACACAVAVHTLSI